MRTRLKLCGLASSGDQARAGIGISGFGADQSRAAFVADQDLGFKLLFKILNVLRARQQAGLL